eukprot:8804908-Karenia_brevis.AAC.1
MDKLASAACGVNAPAHVTSECTGAAQRVPSKHVASEDMSFQVDVMSQLLGESGDGNTQSSSPANVIPNSAPSNGAARE